MEAVWALARHALTTLGGGLVTHGFATSDEVSQAAGALVTLAGVVWSIWTKYQAEQEA